MSAQVARLCVRCNRWVLRATVTMVQDFYGMRAYPVCMDCRRSDDRGPRR
jgi:hypothetical protein